MEFIRPVVLKGRATTGICVDVPEDIYLAGKRAEYLVSVLSKLREIETHPG